MNVSEKLKTRTRLLGIDDATEHNIALFYPNFASHIDEILDQFYDHILSFPEARNIFGKNDAGIMLKQKQKYHWLTLFSCKLYDNYVSNALRIGTIHYRIKVPPYLYMAGYNYFSCKLISVASLYYGPKIELTNILSSISRLVTLDMELSLSAYTKEHWNKKEIPA